MINDDDFNELTPEEIDALADTEFGAMGMPPFKENEITSKFCCPKPDTSMFTDRDLDVLSRVKSMESCEKCASETEICPERFGHFRDMAHIRLMLLARYLYAVTELRGGLHAIGADTSDDIDISINSITYEMDGLRQIIGKLSAAQAGMSGMSDMPDTPGM